MPGLLGLLRYAAIPAAGAAGSYMAGQQEEDRVRKAEHRQTMLDRINEDLHRSTMDENRARADYYRGLGRQPPSHPWRETQSGDVYNEDTGEVHQGAGSQRVHVQGEEHYDPDRNEVGFTTIESNGSPGWKKTRNATMVDKARYQHTPRDPSEPPPELPDVRRAREDQDLDRTADRYVEAAEGDVQKAATMATKDPRGLAAYKRGLGTAHFDAASARYKMRKRSSSSLLGDLEARLGGAAGSAPSATSAPSAPSAPSGSPSTTNSGAVAPAPGGPDPSRSAGRGRSSSPPPSSGRPMPMSSSSGVQTAGREAAKAALRQQFPDKNEAEVEAMLVEIERNVQRRP